MTWEQFFEWLMKWDGKTITNDPRDPGGQTAWGISRRYHPDWPGLALIDRAVTAHVANQHRLLADLPTAERQALDRGVRALMALIPSALPPG